MLPWVALADDADPDATPLARVDAHEELVVTHRKDGAVDALTRDIEAAVVLFREVEGHEDQEKAQERLVKLVGSICKRMKDSNVRKAALQALGEMGHEDCAKFLKPFLKPIRKGGDRVPATLLPAIDAAGCVGDDALVKPLLKIVEDSENYLVAARAAAALGKFRDVKFRSHKEILLTLGKTLVKDQPGSPSRGKSDPDSGAYIPGKSGHAGNARWAALSTEIPKALNELTGQNFRTMGDWMAMIKEHKRNLKILFVDRYQD